jgi:hypothetical protein
MSRLFYGSRTVSPSTANFPAAFLDLPRDPSRIFQGIPGIERAPIMRFGFTCCAGKMGNDGDFF